MYSPCWHLLPYRLQGQDKTIVILPIRISLLLSLAFCWSCASYMTPAGQTYNNDQSYCKILHLPNDIKEQSSPRPFLGISMKPATQEASGLEGCRKFIQVADVIEGSPAMNGGIKENDIILTMNGMPACCETSIPSSLPTPITKTILGTSIANSNLNGKCLRQW